MNERIRLARFAGLFYLLQVILGTYAHLGVRASVHVPGDAVATAQNLAASPTLFRSALAADVAMACAFVVVGATLYLLLRDVDRCAAGALMVFVAVGAGMILINLVFHQGALLVATDPAYGALETEPLALLLLDLHTSGYALAGVFFGLWLLPIGYLGYRSGCLPRLLSILLLLAGASWIIDTLIGVLFPDLSTLAHTIIKLPTFAEFWLVGYLLIKGIRPSTTPHVASEGSTS